MNRLALALALLITLPACSLFGSNPPDVTIRELIVPIVCDTSAKPEPVDMVDTPPSVVFNAETAVWGYWFAPDLYAALAENLQAMRRNMRQQRAIRAKLVGCIDDHNASVPAPEPRAL